MPNAYGSINTVSYSIFNPRCFAQLRLPERVIERTIEGGYWEALKWIKNTAIEFEYEVESVIHESKLGIERKAAA